MKQRLCLTLLLLASLLTPGCSAEEPQPAQSQSSASVQPAAGRAAPDFRLPRLEGGSLGLADFRGKPTIIVFTTTWCPYCIEEIPELKRIYNTYRTQGVGFAAIYIQESPRKVKSFVRKHRLPYPVLLDQNAAVARAYGVRGVPTKVLITATGQTYRNPSWNLTADLEELLARP